MMSFRDTSPMLYQIEPEFELESRKLVFCSHPSRQSKPLTITDAYF